MRIHHAVSALFITMAISVLGTAHAAKLGVRVLDANSGLPVANASVCIGTGAEPTKYGTAVTSYDGMALYDKVPLKPVLITVSKRNLRGIALQAPVLGDNVIKDVLVTEGLSSKKCRALKMVSLQPGLSKGPATDDWPLKIDALSYFPSGDDGLSFLSYSTGKPTHYRVSTMRSFSDAEWKPYSDVLHFAPTGKDRGKPTLYFQLKKQIHASGGTIEAVSDVLSQAVHIK